MWYFNFQLVNLCANDVQRLYDALLYSGFLFSIIPVVDPIASKSK